MNNSQMKEVSATEDVTTRSTHLRAVVLTAGSDLATLTVRAGGSGGTVIGTVKATANTTVPVPDLADMYVAGGLHTLAGTGPVATFIYA
jgi:hypothetical protein